MLTLYSTPLSANGRKVLAVSRHLRLDADVKTINVYAGEDRVTSRSRLWGDFLNEHLSGREFLVGDELTLADFAVGAMMMYVRRAAFPFDDFVNIAAWYARLEGIEAWKATAVGPWRY